MQITVEAKPLEQVETDALDRSRVSKAERRIGSAQPTFDAGEVTGKLCELTLLHHAPGFAAKRVLLAGAGKPEKFDPGDAPESWPAPPCVI